MKDSICKNMGIVLIRIPMIEGGFEDRREKIYNIIETSVWKMSDKCKAILSSK
jgi:O-phosphoseryl-tRNA(Cys) synthetase